MYQPRQGTAFLSEGDLPPFEIVNPAANCPLLLTGDHAGNVVPKALGNLGLAPGERDRHIGWDIGIADLTRLLAARLGATAVLARYTRLLIDPNRPLGDTQSIPSASDGTPIPANRNLSERDRIDRADALYWPYHCAIDEHIARLQRTGQVPVVLAMHSFTPSLKTEACQRPWHVGVLFGSDERLSHRLIDAFANHNEFVVGVNQPYSGVTHGYALKVHGLAHGLPHAELEIRQDLIDTPDGRKFWADLLTDALRDILAQDDLRKIEHY